MNFLGGNAPVLATDFTATQNSDISKYSRPHLPKEIATVGRRAFSLQLKVSKLGFFFLASLVGDEGIRQIRFLLFVRKLYYI